MPSITDQTIHDTLASLITLVAVAYVLWFLVKRLTRTRDELRIGVPVAVALGVRIVAAIGVSQLAVASTLRGGDEDEFLRRADILSGLPLGNDAWTTELTGHLHEFVFGAQLRILDSPDLALRIAQAGIAVAGLILLAVAVYELAGPRAGRLAAWLLALEPTNVFFSTLLHKEPNMILAGGLVALGGAMMWKHAQLRYLLPIVLGCLVAVATRPYAGWFLIAAGAAITLHAGLRASRDRSEDRSLRALTLVSIVVLFGAVAAPTVWEASTPESLEELQASQNANAANEDANLSLERVNFSTREGILTNLPTRVKDVLLRPYPWQLGNTEQRFGLMGTLVALTLLILLVRYAFLSWGSIMARAGPLIYVGMFTLTAYSLSAGNAGTAFRYRTHVVALAICIVVVLAARLREPAESTASERPEAEPVVARAPGFQPGMQS